MGGNMSSSEREIREAVVARLRVLMPSARIVHELNVSGQGSNRIDVAAIATHAIVGIEIKSERDTLKRLGEQWAAFSACCHKVIVAAHEKHFAEYRWAGMRADAPGETRLNHPGFFESCQRDDAVWRYPRPADVSRWRLSWSFQPLKDLRRQPQASAMLGMLWADELREECAHHRIGVTSKWTRPEMISEMVWRMTGREIAEAACRQLRGRTFAEADPSPSESSGFQS